MSVHRAGEADSPPPLGSGFGEIGPQMDPPGFFTPQGGVDHNRANRQHVLQLPARWIGELTIERIPTPMINRVGGLT